MNAPIYNPIVPFTMGVQMEPGRMIYINGVPQAGRFSVNLKSDLGPNHDNLFHFNARFDQGNVIVRNTLTRGQWGPEERQINSFPFVVGQQFEIIILCQQHQYKVAVNGRHLLEYKHRIGFHAARYFTVEGSVALTMIRTDMEFAGKPTASRLITNPVMPFTAQVPFNNIKGHKMIVSGVPLGQHPQRFAIDFGPLQGGDVFFHFNPRFDQNEIVRNTKLSGGWGAEERQLSIPFPFQLGVPYQLTFHVEQGSFRVELNGLNILNYVHRKRPLNLIQQVMIHGATTLSRIEFR